MSPRAGVATDGNIQVTPAVKHDYRINRLQAYFNRSPTYSSRYLDQVSDYVLLLPSVFRSDRS